MPYSTGKLNASHFAPKYLERQCYRQRNCNILQTKAYKTLKANTVVE